MRLTKSRSGSFRWRVGRRKEVSRNHPISIVLISIVLILVNRMSRKVLDRTSLS